MITIVARLLVVAGLLASVGACAYTGTMPTISGGGLTVNLWSYKEMVVVNDFDPLACVDITSEGGFAVDHPYRLAFGQRVRVLIAETLYPGDRVELLAFINDCNGKHFITARQSFYRSYRGGGLEPTSNWVIGSGYRH